MLRWMENQKWILSPDWVRYLESRGGTQSLREEIGLVSWEDNHAPEDNYLNKYPMGGKLVIPVVAPSGHWVGFEHRDMLKQSVRMYLEERARWNPIFLGMKDWIPEAVFSGRRVWIVEGVFDWIALRKACPSDLVLGTFRAQFTQAHAEFFRRYAGPSTEVWLAYDNDEAGRNAVNNSKKTGSGAISRLRKVGVRCVDFKYRGKDPGDLLRDGENSLLMQFASGV